MHFLSFFQWCYQTPIGESIRESTWLFPVIEAFHLIGFGLTIGAVLMVDLRLLGFGLVKQPVGQIASATEPWLLTGIAVMFASGVPLFVSEAIKCYNSFPFWVKMTSLLLVLLFTFTLHRRVALADLTGARPALGGKAAALISLILWFGVAWGGRWIGFS
jgi:hypothetical protein